VLDVATTRALFWLHSDALWPSNTRLFKRDVWPLKHHLCMNDNPSMSVRPTARIHFKRSKSQQPEAGLTGPFRVMVMALHSVIIITQCKEGDSRKDFTTISNAAELRSRPFPGTYRATGDVADHICSCLGESHPSMVTCDLSLQATTQTGSFRCRLFLDPVPYNSSENLRKLFLGPGPIETF
jgi:hypothetical protein